MWTGALSALPMSVPRHPEPVRFTGDEADEVIAAIGAALEDAELTVDELTHAIRARTGPWAVERTMDAFQDKWPCWRQLTSTAAHRGVLCFGPNKGRNVTYSNPHRWLPGLRPLAGSEAVSLLVRRYLHVFGPASTEHFARWLAIPPRGAREAFETLGNELEPVEVDGERAYVATGDAEVPSRQAEAIRLLPYFDPYVVAGQPRARLFPGAAAARADPDRPSRELPGAARRWCRRRRLARAAVSQARRDHGRAASRAHAGATTRPRGRCDDRRPGGRG